MDTSKKYIKMCEKAEEIQEIPITAWAYLAGLIDGEGTISIRNKTPRSRRHKTNHYNLEVYITSTNRPMLEWVVETFGGKIYTYQRENDTKRLPQHKWHVHGNKAKWILENVLLFLIIKKKHAKLGIEFRNQLNRDTSWHAKFAEKLKSIQKSIVFEKPIHVLGQDQLQEMVFNKEIDVNASGLVERFNNTLSFWAECGYSNNDKINPSNWTMEQLWLAFVMREKYRKVWNGKGWRHI